MNLHASEMIFLAGLLAYVAIRSTYQRRAAETPARITRSTGRDRALIVLVVLGQIVLPLLYVFSPWLDFANYASPFAAWSGAVVWLAGIRRSGARMRTSAATGR
jgi:hypothetical protein